MANVKITDLNQYNSDNPVFFTSIDSKSAAGMHFVIAAKNNQEETCDNYRISLADIQAKPMADIEELSSRAAAIDSSLLDSTIPLSGFLSSSMEDWKTLDALLDGYQLTSDAKDISSTLAGGIKDLKTTKADASALDDTDGRLANLKTDVNNMSNQMNALDKKFDNSSTDGIWQVLSGNEQTSEESIDDEKTVFRGLAFKKDTEFGQFTAVPATLIDAYSISSVSSIEDTSDKSKPPKRVFSSLLSTSDAEGVEESHLSCIYAMLDAAFLTISTLQSRIAELEKKTACVSVETDGTSRMRVDEISTGGLSVENGNASSFVDWLDHTHGLTAIGDISSTTAATI